MMKKFELSVYGAKSVRSYKIPHYKKFHDTLDDALEAARNLHTAMRIKRLPSMAHPVIINGPFLGPDGRTVYGV